MWSQALLCTESVYDCMTLRLRAIICPRTVSSHGNQIECIATKHSVSANTDTNKRLLCEGRVVGGVIHHTRVFIVGAVHGLEGQCTFAWQDRQVLLKTMRIN